MVMNQLIHQYNGTANLRQLTSNLEPIFPKPVLCFQISWGDLISMPLLILTLSFNLHIFQLNLTMDLFQIQTPLKSNQLMMMKWTISWNSSTRNFFDLLDVDLQMIQGWLVVTPSSKAYTVYTILFHKYGGANVAFTNFMSHSSMFLPTNDTVKLANGNMRHSQGAGIVLCCLPNCSIIYMVGPFY